MSNQKTNPELPEIPPLTKDQLHRLLAADYLEAMAKMIRRGQTVAFDLAWDLSMDKPVGKVEVDSNTIIAPLEARIMQDMAEAQAAAARKIPYQDMTQEIQNHGKCESPTCVACNNPNKA